MLGLLKRILRRSRVLLGLVRFMRRRVIWPVRRRREAKAYFRSHETRKLNIGAGPDFLPAAGAAGQLAAPARSAGEGWLNTDRNPDHSRGVAYLDATEPFPFKDSTFDYVTSEHLIEHLTSDEGGRMLGECFRVLRPGGRIRIATPDLRVYVDLFRPDKSDVQRRYIRYHVDKFLPSLGPQPSKALRSRAAERSESGAVPKIAVLTPGGPSSDAVITTSASDARPEGLRALRSYTSDAVLTCFVINNEFRNWGHRFIYDRETLSAAMERAGFVDVVRYASGESDDENLRGIECHGKVVKNR